MANHMGEVARMLGVEIGEEFFIGDDRDDVFRITLDCFEFKEISDSQWRGNRFAFEKLLNGKWEIAKKPWKPKDGETYWSVTCLGKVAEIPFDWLGCGANDYKIGNCYRTRAEAEADAEKWKSWFESDEQVKVI